MNRTAPTHKVEIVKAIQTNWTKSPQIANEQAAFRFLIQLGYTADFEPTRAIFGMVSKRNKLFITLTPGSVIFK